MADDQMQKVRGKLELCRWMTGVVGSPCHALPDGEGAAGQGLKDLRNLALEA